MHADRRFAAIAVFQYFQILRPIELINMSFKTQIDLAYIFQHICEETAEANQQIKSMTGEYSNYIRYAGYVPKVAF